MVDVGLIYTVLGVTAAGVVLVFLGAAGFIAYQLTQDRLDAKAGVPLPGGSAAQAEPEPGAAGDRGTLVGT
ncbi:hypothetical protein [Nocardiopsis coralliicola]